MRVVHLLLTNPDLEQDACEALGNRLLKGGATCMPNWCQNVLQVIGEKPEVLRFVRQAEGPDSALVFDNFVPMPKTKENTEGEGWYDWCIAQWGTKWDACDVDRINEHDRFVIYKFDTAWSSPVAWLEAVAEQYPVLHFTLTYEEPGNAFGGKAVGIRGEVSDESWNQ